MTEGSKQFRVLINRYKETGLFSDKIKMAEHASKIGAFLLDPISQDDVLDNVLRLEAEITRLKNRTLIQRILNK